MAKPPENAPIQLEVGDRVWVFDENRRRYRTDDKGHSIGAPIWKDHWVEHRVVGANRASFFLWMGTRDDHVFKSDWTRIYRRLSKADLKLGKIPNGIAFSEKDINRKAWIHENAYKLSDKVQRCSDFDALAEVARLVAPELLPPKDT